MFKKCEYNHPKIMRCLNEIRFFSFSTFVKNEYDFISMPWMIGLIIMFNIKIYNLEDQLA